MNEFLRKIRRFAIAVEFQSGWSIESIASHKCSEAWDASRIELEIRHYMNEGRK